MRDLSLILSFWYSAFTGMNCSRMMENKYPKEYECSKHIAEYIEKEYGSGIASEEIMFLAIHIKRVCMAG